MNKVQTEAYELQTERGSYQIAFRCQGTAKYYFREVRAGAKPYWQELNQDNLVLRLRTECGLGKDNIPVHLMQIQRDHKVKVGMQIAGINEGIYDMSLTGTGQSMHNNILNMSNGDFIEGVKGECPVIDKMLQGQIGHTPRQLDTLYGWLQHGRKAIRNSVPTPNSIMFFIGTVRSGKNLLQEVLIAQAFNGLWANASEIIVKSSSFNKEACEKCLWIVSDESLSKYTGTRENVSDKLKRVASTTFEAFQPKGVDASTIHLNRFCTVSCNLDERSIASVPLLEKGSNVDKFSYILLDNNEVNKHVPFDLKNGEYPLLVETIKKELPAFLYKVDNYTPPEHLKDSRHTIKTFQHPEIVKRIEDSEPFMQLLGFLKNEDVAREMFKYRYDAQTKLHYVKNENYRASAQKILEVLDITLGVLFRDFKNTYVRQAHSMGHLLRKAADYLAREETPYIIGGADLHTKKGNEWQISYKLYDTEVLSHDEYNEEIKKLEAEDTL